MWGAHGSARIFDLMRTVWPSNGGGGTSAPIDHPLRAHDDGETGFLGHVSPGRLIVSRDVRWAHESGVEKINHPGPRNFQRLMSARR